MKNSCDFLCHFDKQPSIESRIAGVVFFVYGNQYFTTTQILSGSLGINPNALLDNFRRNEKRFKECRHYLKIEGRDLKIFKSSHHHFVDKYASSLFLWSPVGALALAKISESDDSWEIYDKLFDYIVTSCKSVKNRGAEFSVFDLFLVKQGVENA